MLLNRDYFYACCALGGTDHCISCPRAIEHKDDPIYEWVYKPISNESRQSYYLHRRRTIGTHHRLKFEVLKN